MSQEITAGTKIEPDELFEKFLEEKTRSKTVSLLARASFYGETVLRVLYPEDADAPPDIVADTPLGPTGPTRPASLRYNVEDIKAAGVIVDSFDKLHPGRFDKYRQILRARKQASRT